MESEQSTAGKKTSKNYFVFIDESGDLGKSANSDPYLVFAASVTDKPEEFVKIADKYISNVHKSSQLDELKFSKSTNDVKAMIINDINLINPDIYAAVVIKSHPHWKEKKKMYQQALSEFIDFIIKDLEDCNYYFILDEHTAISTESEPNKGCEICETVAAKYGINVECKMLKSKDTKSLQTHDFIVGSIGSAFNRLDNRYICKLKKVKYKEGEAYYIKKF